MTAAIAWDGVMGDLYASALKAQRCNRTTARVDPQGVIDLLNVVEAHRKRDELVLAALQEALEKGCATGSGTTLAQRVLDLYEGNPT